MLKKERFNAKYNTAMAQIPRSIERISSFWMKLSVAMKFAKYVAWILICKQFKFDEKITTIPENIECLLGGGVLFGAPYIWGM